MVERNLIDQAANLLLRAAPQSKVILFGSHARGEEVEGSDLDFLVVEPKVRDRLAEMVRLRQALEPVLQPRLLSADVLVVSQDQFDRWKNTPNTIYNEAERKGRRYG